MDFKSKFSHSGGNMMDKIFFSNEEIGEVIGIDGVLMIKRGAFFVDALLLRTCLDLETIQATVNWWATFWE